MLNGKTYYQILGVIVDADEVVIKAAYRSLSNKFHPDRWAGDPRVAHECMVEINAAYAVLGDVSKRAAYDDELRSSGAYSDLSEDEVDESSDSCEEDSNWLIAKDFYPDLQGLYESLCLFSRALAESFKLQVTQEKSFDRRVTIAEDLKARYLKKYFGANEKIQLLAAHLFEEGYRRETVLLNKMVVAMGDSVSPESVIEKIRAKAPKRWKPEDALRVKDLLGKARAPGDSLFGLIELAKKSDIYIEVKHSVFTTTYEFWWAGKRHKFFEQETWDWLVENVAKKAAEQA